MRFSVSLQAEGDREITLDEVLELADAVAPLNGIASGFGTYTYGAQIVIEAEGPDQAVDQALAEFAQAVASTSLPDWPVAYAEAISEDDDFADLDDIPT
jgi:hypothetical protein